MELDERIARLSPAKRELLDQWLADERDGHAASARYAPARTDSERLLVSIWEQALEAERVGIDDDYFELGGDSIDAIVIVGKAQEAGIPLEAAALFEHRTVRALAQCVTAAAGPPRTAAGEQPGGAAATATGAWPGLPPAAYPLTPLQAGMLYHAVGGSTPGAYLVQLRGRLDGVLRTDAFRAAWQAVYAANPALHSVFRWNHGGQPYQLAVPGPVMPVEIIDHTAMGAQSRDAAFATLVETDRTRGFDLENGPLMRLTLVSEGPASLRCVWTYHHLILDGWAQQLILRDVFDCYERLCAGLPAAPRTRPPFASYLSWLERQPEPDDGFWAGRLAGLASPTRVAGPGCADGRVVAAARPMVELPLPAALAGRLPEFSRTHGVTASSVIHGGWALLLGLHCAADDVLFGSTVSGRPPELRGATECVGMFASTLPLRVRCPDDAITLDWLRGVQQELAGLNRQPHASLSRIERVAGLGHGSGLFDSIVVVENYPTWLRAGDQVAGTRISELAVVVEEGYPLVLEFTPGPAAVLRARYDEHRIPLSAASCVLHALAGYLRRVLADPAIRLGALREAVAADWRRYDEEHRREQATLARQRLAAAQRRAVPGTGHGAAR
jgi:nonribosomal peptide synthetase protein BlmV